MDGCFEPNVNMLLDTHVNECAPERMCSEVIGWFTEPPVQQQRRGERREAEDALLQLINQRLLAWK